MGLSPRVRGNRRRGHSRRLRLGSIPACAGEPYDPVRGSWIIPVYPRVCGGTMNRSLVQVLLAGLSPRVRGNLRRRSGAADRIGSIPACAGEPGPAAVTLAAEKVYPRVCGGTSTSIAMTDESAGLSPRVRGNQRPHGAGGPGNRSIPACAGEPRIRFPVCVYGAVYPRVCGGTTWRAWMLRLICGLSPRVRGNLPIHNRDTVHTGSIPACAGEPRLLRLIRGRSRVYPRVCGGTESPVLMILIGTGLSPRVRGNRQQQVIPLTRRRSIPACAGEPRNHQGSPKSARVYPRVCGGTLLLLIFESSALGLSPRVRGNPAASDFREQCPGSIPACAGEPLPRRTQPPPLRSIPACAGEPCSAGVLVGVEEVYPRVCGGTADGRERNFWPQGLSPRVRGNHLTLDSRL